MRRLIKTVRNIILIVLIIGVGSIIFIRSLRNFVIGRTGTIIWELENKVNLRNKVQVPEDYPKVDKNNNGIPDPIDVVRAARKEAKSKTKYRDAYYAGGYPPEGEGVCTDVIWRGLEGIDINLKNLIDEDIKNNKENYWRIDGKADQNIDFRRVPNQLVYFQQHAISLTTEMIPGDIENLTQWQPGDIIVMLKPYEHVAIVSDKRNTKGV
ncbi:MAG: DUF1287 domain-containing protein, partial [Clostridium sp.]